MIAAGPIYALTIWQPWASLIIGGWKPYEFRGWDYRARRGDLVGKRIGIHAGGRPVRRIEVADLLDSHVRQDCKFSAAAISFLETLYLSPEKAPLSALLGTAKLLTPLRCEELFGHSGDGPDAWAWPLTEIERFEPLPARGAQGFWRYGEMPVAPMALL